MSNDKITGVFVRLPLSDEAARLVRMAYASSADSDESFAKAAVNIGTPVTGGDIPVVAYTSQYDTDRIKKGKSGDIYGSQQWDGSDDPVFDIPLVRKSDHLAALASLQAEVEELQRHLSSTLEVALSRADGTTCIHLVKQAFSLAKTTELTADEVVSRTLGELFPIMKDSAP